MLYSGSLQLVSIFSNTRALDGVEDERGHDLQNEVKKHGRHVLDVRVDVRDY